MSNKKSIQKEIVIFFNIAFSNSLVVDNDQAAFMNRRSANLFEFSEGNSKLILNSDEGSINMESMKKMGIGMNMNQFVSSLFSQQKKPDEN